MLSAKWQAFCSRGDKLTKMHDAILNHYVSFSLNDPDSKVHRANMGPIWNRQDPGGPHVGPMNFAIWGSNYY